MNSELRTKAKYDFKKYFQRLMINAVFVKAMENVRNHRDIELVTTNKRGYYASQPNYSTKLFSEDVLAIEINKTEIKKS